MSIVINTPEENVVATLTGKKVLFLENDNCLSHGLDEFERILKRAKIKYKCLFGISNKRLQTVLNNINKHDAIVFQTQWVYKISNTLLDYVSKLQDKKVVIECYIADPTWYYAKQHGTHHDVYIYKCPIIWGEPEKDLERFYKLTNKSYWDYKNKFDK